MKIDVSSLLEHTGSKLQWKGNERFRFDDWKGDASLDLDFILTRAGSEILVQGTAKGNLPLACANCLVDLVYPVSLQISEAFLPLSQAIPQVAEEAVLEELAIFTYGADHLLDPSEPIRQALLLELPMHPTCRKECKGLCPACGMNWNEGECACPREPKNSSQEIWAPLRILKKKGESKE